MDVTSLLASISSLADGAFKLVSFINTIKEGGKQRLRLFTELNSLWMVLKLLEYHLGPDEVRSEPWLQTIAILDKDDGIFDQIRAAFDDLTSRLQPKSGHRKFVQTLRWPFDKSEVESLTAHLERLKNSVNLALNSTNAAITREIQNDTKFIKLSVTRNEVEAILDWISSLNFVKQQVFLTRLMLFRSVDFSSRTISSMKFEKALANGFSNDMTSRYGYQAMKPCFGVQESPEQARLTWHQSSLTI